MTLRAGALQAGLMNQSSAQVIDGSLKFDSSKEHYLNRTPSSAGNRKTWTWSCWTKLSAVNQGMSSTHWFLQARSAVGSTSQLKIDIRNDHLRVNFRSGGSTVADFEGSSVLRDFSAWYHFLIACDTTQSTESDRLKFYINGREEPASAVTYPSLNFESDLNSAISHQISQNIPNSAPEDYSGYYLSEAYLIDGQALGPEYFGYTDPLTNTWRPKKFKPQATPNDGRIWSSGVTLSGENGTSNPSNLFDGVFSVNNTSNILEGSAQDQVLTVTFSTPITGDLIEIYRVNGSVSNSTVAVNGSGSISFGLNSWTTLTGATSVSSIAITPAAGTFAGLSGIRVDGVLLIDGDTSNMGLNGFHLPFDGSAPIGQDRSGRGNNWTPVNFGGLVSLEKATGALPILNTDGGGKVARVGVRTDAFASNLVLALPLVGIKSDFSNAINSGTSNKNITNNNTVSFASTIGNFYTASASFLSNTSSYLSSSSPTQLGSGDFTVEFWTYITANQNDKVFYFLGNNSSYGLLIYLNASKIEIYGSSNGTSWDLIPQITLVNNPPLNTWNHVAIVRQGTSITGYFNGVSVSLTTSSSSFVTATREYIGGSGASNSLPGYIQDFRVYKGVAKYTSNFIPASTDPDILPDTPSGVSGSSKLTKITDGAVSFDGNGDYLNLAYSADWTLGTTWTIEAFIYLNAISNEYSIIASQHTGSAGGNTWFFAVVGTSNGTASYRKGLEWFSSGGQINTSGNPVIDVSKWYHVAISCSSGTATIYVDGQNVGSGSVGTIPTASNPLYIGHNNISGNELNGFISNLRVIKGTALYTTNFTPPTAPLSAVANTKLLCCQSNTQAGAAVTSPNMGGINDGRVWSDANIGDPIRSGQHIDAIFDGNSSTGSETDNGVGKKLLFDFENTFGSIPVSSSIKVWIGGSDGRTLKVNGTTIATNANSASNPFTITNQSQLNSVEVLSESSTRSGFLNQISVDDVPLTNPVIRNGNAAATNFNPFTVDIDTVRGKQSGYCTLNPLDIPSNAVSGGSVTVKNGNLVADNTAGAGTNYSLVSSTIGFTTSNTDTGYYLEVLNPNTLSGNPAATGFSLWYPQGGVYDALYPPGRETYNPNNGFTYNVAGTSFPWGSSFVAGNPTWSAAGSVFSVAVKGSNVWVAVNGIWVNGGNPATNTSPFTTIPAGYSQVFPAALCLEGADLEFNFGQKPFKFPPPAGFQPLNSANVRPETVIVRPDQYVGIVTYTGNGTSQTISGLGFSPDLVYIANRTTEEHKVMYDTIRGATNQIYTNLINSETPQATTLTSFTSDGFTVSSDDKVNELNNGIVAWCWKAGGSSNTFNIDDVGYDTASAAGLDGGSLTPTGASVNTKSGFSIITASPAQTANSISHGLGAEPYLIISKSRTVAYDWNVYHKDLGTGQFLRLNTTAAAQAVSGYWGTVNSTTFGVDTGNNANNSGDMVYYCWAEIPGFSKFGSYVGQDANNQFVELGFRPALVWIKATTTGTTYTSWWIADAERNKYNPTGGANTLWANKSVGEGYRGNGSDQTNLTNIDVDFLSNGFCVTGGNSDEINDATYGPFIYAAWAEAPSFNLYGATSNAR